MLSPFCLNITAWSENMVSKALLLEAPCAHRLRKTVSPGRLSLGIALLVCSRALCPCALLWFCADQFCYLLCVHRHRQSDPPGRLFLIFALLVRFRGCVFCVLVFCFVSCVECWSRHHMCSAVYVCVRLLLCMRVCVLSVCLCLCVHVSMCVCVC